ncbi:hypothetical protein TNIN_442701 [Trichonephila inaurata madagascariensis]|uniref:Uncharacterized protein n=1 Tax=Trichonephila inaurata madagascariensis TaxID=2747483 RepID=A0A8X6WZC6_9ARAC|nr:hypothetical protein TNIN_442701 [Trichonephila inaurata madagascariensis]
MSGVLEGMRLSFITSIIRATPHWTSTFIYFKSLSLVTVNGIGLLGSEELELPMQSGIASTLEGGMKTKETRDLAGGLEKDYIRRARKRRLQKETEEDVEQCLARNKKNCSF